MGQGEGTAPSAAARSSAVSPRKPDPGLSSLSLGRQFLTQLLCPPCLARLAPPQSVLVCARAPKTQILGWGVLIDPS